MCSQIMYFDAANGVSGDMFVGAMIDMGADFEKIKSDVMSLGIEGIELKAEKQSTHGITATKFSVLEKATGRDIDSVRGGEHRHLSDIRDMLCKSSLDRNIISSATFIFEIIAQAEADVHGESIECVHFHEVGAIDSIVDIVAAASAFHQFDAEACASPINTGSGTIECQHGILPVPAPAVLKMLRGIPVFSDGVQTELATPTGVALLKYFCDSYGDIPKMKVYESGTGMGTRNIGRPNVFRVMLGEAV